MTIGHLIGAAAGYFLTPRVSGEEDMSLTDPLRLHGAITGAAAVALFNIANRKNEPHDISSDHVISYAIWTAVHFTLLAVAVIACVARRPEPLQELAHDSE